MGLFLPVLAIMLAVASSGVIVRFVKLPLPFLQVGVGIALGVFGLKVVIEPGLFFVLFAAPLLFDEAWRISKRELHAVRWTVGALAIGLVVLTVVAVGLLTHTMLPAVPLAAAFALAAALSPTDAVALKSVPSQMAMPARIRHIVEGEALINDATGLVCLQLAVAAAGASHFSLPYAALDFIWVGAGGLVVGGAVTWAFRWIQRRIIRLGGEHAPTQVLLGLLLPLVAYLGAEALEVSGILAAVGAGFMMDRTALSGTGQLATRMQRGSVWDMLEFTLNGFIFVLLGIQLPLIGLEAKDLATAYSGGNLVLLASYPLILWAIILALRLIWIGITVHFTVLRRKRSSQQVGERPIHTVSALTLGGVRGVLTLAAVLSIPASISGGMPFPARDLLIFLAVGTILISMVATSVGFPIALRHIGRANEDPAILRERRTRRKMAEAALGEIERAQTGFLNSGMPAERAAFDEAAATLMDEYLAQVELSNQTEGERASVRRLGAADRKLRLAGLQAERRALYPLRETGEIDEAGFRTLLQELDFAETAIVGDKGQR
jgi:CPA1 family monovalent cation:H+ antiporter